MSEQVRFDTDDLIYNRFDLIYKDGNRKITLCEEREKYCLDLHIEDANAELNVWGKTLPQNIFDRAVEIVFENKQVCALELTRCRNPYDGFLGAVNDIRVPLPNDVDELLARVERRDRATIRRKKRWLDERIGKLEMLHFSREDISDEIVCKYFNWKLESYGTNYHLEPQEYLNKFHVTDALFLKAGEESVAVAFYCKVNETVFFENFSYNSTLKEYSPGLLMYEMLLERLIQERCKFLYLGGGNYIYKKRFGAESHVAYSGIIYRCEIVETLNTFFKEKKISKVAIYGMGVCGQVFLNLRNRLSVDVLYGIDQKGGKDMGIPVYFPNENFPAADAIVITMNTRCADVESFLEERSLRFFYWKDILTYAQEEYLQGRI